MTTMNQDFKFFCLLLLLFSSALGFTRDALNVVKIGQLQSTGIEVSGTVTHNLEGDIEYTVSAGFSLNDCIEELMRHHVHPSRSRICVVPAGTFQFAAPLTIPSLPGTFHIKGAGAGLTTLESVWSDANRDIPFIPNSAYYGCFTNLGDAIFSDFTMVTDGNSPFSLTKGHSYLVNIDMTSAFSVAAIVAKYGTLTARNLMISGFTVGIQSENARIYVEAISSATHSDVSVVACSIDSENGVRATYLSSMEIKSTNITCATGSIGVEIANLSSGDLEDVRTNAILLVARESAMFVTGLLNVTLTYSESNFPLQATFGSHLYLNGDVHLSKPSCTTAVYVTRSSFLELHNSLQTHCECTSGAVNLSYSSNGMYYTEPIVPSGLQFIVGSNSFNYNKV